MGVVLVDEDGNPVGDDFVVAPDNAELWEIAQRCDTQFIRCPFSGRIQRLCYEALPVVLGAMGIPLTQPLLDDLRVIERGALGHVPACLDEVAGITVTYHHPEIDEAD